MTDEAVVRLNKLLAHGVQYGAFLSHQNEAWDDLRALLTAYEANRTDVEELRKEAAFLCERMRDFSWTVDANDAEDIYREFHGHVMPSLARMDEALTRISSLEKKGS